MRRAKSPHSGSKLVAKTSTDSDALASLGSPTAEDGGSALGLHTGTETVRLHALPAIGLKRALGHDALLKKFGRLSIAAPIRFICFARKLLFEQTISDYTANALFFHSSG